MWVITHIQSGNKFYLISDVKRYLVGRVGSDIVLSDDTSISRSHAVFQVTDNVLLLEDLGSKYGTYYNENIETKTKLPKGKPIELQEGDHLLFGALKNEWLISKNNITSLTSSLSGSQLNELKSLLNSLGGKIISKWEPRCSHLTMSEITITIKVLHALIEKIPIVSCEYWKDYLKNLREKKQPPKAALYLPERCAYLSSAIDVANFNFNDKRKTLFSGKTFVFMSKKHYDMYSPIVRKAGGECKDLKNNVHKSYLLQKNVIVVQYVASTQSQGSQTINTIAEYLEASSLRTIPEYEIGLAIVCCTTEKHCNPSYNPMSNILPNSADRSPNIGTILAENTRSEKSQFNTHELSVAEIPDSGAFTKKIVPGKPLQSEIYENQSDSDVICIENSEKSEALGDISQIPESHSSNESKRKRQNIEGNEKELPVSKKSHIFDEDSFSGNLNMSADMLSNGNEILNSCDHNKSKEAVKRPSTVTDSELRPALISARLTETSNKIKKTQKSSTVPVKCIPHRPTEKDKLTVPEKSTTQPKSRYSGFLQKSQINHSHREAQTTNTDEQQQIRSTKKRGRIARITDNDSDNEDDIFNFGCSPKKSKASGYNSDEELFGGKPSADEVDREKVLSQTQRFIPNKRLDPKATKLNIKVSPLKVSSQGWLSKLDKLTIKCDDDTELKKENDVEDPKHNDWIESIKGGFEVRVRKMNLSSRGSNCSTAHQSSNSTTTNKKNFKAFVKKHNYKPQTLIIRTVSTVVPPMH